MIGKYPCYWTPVSFQWSSFSWILSINVHNSYHQPKWHLVCSWTIYIRPTTSCGWRNGADLWCVMFTPIVPFNLCSKLTHGLPPFDEARQCLTRVYSATGCEDQLNSSLQTLQLYEDICSNNGTVENHICPFDHGRFRWGFRWMIFHLNLVVDG